MLRLNVAHRPQQVVLAHCHGVHHTAALAHAIRAPAAATAAAFTQGLTLVHVRAELEQLQDTFMI